MNDTVKVDQPTAINIHFTTLYLIEEVNEISFQHECVKFFAKEYPDGAGYEDTEPYIFRLINQDRSPRGFHQIGTDGEKSIMDAINNWIVGSRPGFVLSRAVFYPRRSLSYPDFRSVEYKPKVKPCPPPDPNRDRFTKPGDVKRLTMPKLQVSEVELPTTQTCDKLSEHTAQDLLVQLQICVVMALNGTVQQKEEARLFLRNYFFGTSDVKADESSEAIIPNLLTVENRFQFQLNNDVHHTGFSLDVDLIRKRGVQYSGLMERKSFRFIPVFPFSKDEFTEMCQATACQPLINAINDFIESTSPAYELDRWSYGKTSDIVRSVGSLVRDDDTSRS